MPKYSYEFDGNVAHDFHFISRDESGKKAKIGQLRVKPSGLGWKKKGSAEFFTVPLDKFMEWITSTEANAKKTAS